MCGRTVLVRLKFELDGGDLANDHWSVGKEVLAKQTCLKILNVSRTKLPLASRTGQLITDSDTRTLCREDCRRVSGGESRCVTRNIRARTQHTAQVRAGERELFISMKVFDRKQSVRIEFDAY